ncbi:MAG: polymorphic toxin-type HINT domain-containing protein [Pseudanabaena sp.]
MPLVDVSGFAHAVSFGQSTRYRNWAYGEVANQNHQGFLWNMGMLSGISVSLLTGLRVSQTLTFGMGAAQWLAVAHTAGSTFTAAYDAGSRVRDKGVGGLEWQDSFLLLPFIPYAAPAAKTFLANARAVNGKLKNWGQMKVGSSAEPVTTPSCFVAGTEILTTEGIKNIEDIKVGDWVIADDPNTVGEIEAKQVLQTFVHDVASVVDIYLNGEKITTTDNHPFWVENKGWVEAKDLQAGDQLQNDKEENVTVDHIEHRLDNVKVYNFEVQGFHTYFVSDLGILVHNTCGKPPYSPDPKKWTAKGGTIDENWTYTDWEGNTVSYSDGYPDFRAGGYVRAEVEIQQKGNYTTDFTDATAANGGVQPEGTTWHHHQNGTTMQAVDEVIHRRFTHRGGVSIMNNGD